MNLLTCFLAVSLLIIIIIIIRLELLGELRLATKRGRWGGGKNPMGFSFCIDQDYTGDS